MSGGERIKTARRRKGFTQNKLAELVGCSQQTIVDIEKQDVPRSKFLPQIVLALEESLEWVQSGRGAPANGGDNCSALPHYDLESVAIKSMDASRTDEVIDYLFCAPTECSPSGFTVEVDEVGVSCLGWQSANPGDIAFFDPAAPIKPGDFCLAVLPGFDRAEFRRFVSVGGERFLVQKSGMGAESVKVEIYDSYAEYQNAVPPDGVLPALICGRLFYIGCRY